MRPVRTDQNARFRTSEELLASKVDDCINRLQVDRKSSCIVEVLFVWFAKPACLHCGKAVSTGTTAAERPKLAWREALDSPKHLYHGPENHLDPLPRAH